MIAILGDIHFSSLRDYFTEASAQFIKWFTSWEKNRKGNNLILAGDLVQNALNGGVVVSYLEEFYTSSRFDHIYIVVGNHDLKKVNGIDQLAYSFYSLKDNVSIYTEPTEVVIENKRVLMLPYFDDVDKKGRSMAELYSSIYKGTEFSNKYDLVVGHFAGRDASFPGSVDCIENLEKINTKKLCLGHIHTRMTDPKKYIGSVFANRKGEEDNTRAAWILDGDTWYEDRLPVFVEFLEVTYPNSLPSSGALVPVYTVLNCSSEALAKSLYGDIYIRRVKADLNDSPLKHREFQDIFSSTKHTDIETLFNKFISIKTPPLDPAVEEKCREALLVV